MQKRFSDKTLSIVRAVIEPVLDGVYITDKVGNFIMANKAFERITGINRKEMEGKHTNYLLENKWVTSAVNLEVMQDYRSRTRMIRYPSGKLILVSAGMIFRDNGQPAGCISILRDLTELNELKEKLTRSQVKIAEFRDKIDYLEELLDNNKHELVAQSTEFKRILALAKRVARSDATVLITGESGVGKDLVANYIHFHSKRKDTGSFIKIDCASLPSTLLESELFGYEKGAFTDARIQGKRGLFEIANGGTLFLDEIAEIPLELQSKLLNVLQDREIKRVGGNRTLPIDVRIISATNVNLERRVKDHEFREDLYYRLNVVPIHVSPLRERTQDILPLVRHFLQSFNERYQTHKCISTRVLSCLLNYEWPGNTRELRNTIERLVVTSTEDIIIIQDLPESIAKGRPAGAPDPMSGSNIPRPIGPLRTMMDELERELIKTTLQTHGNLIDAARELQIDVSTLTRKNRKYGLTGYIRTASNAITADEAIE